MKVDHPERGPAFVQLSGNRRITIFKEKDMYVWAVFTDMSVTKPLLDSLKTVKPAIDTTIKSN